MLMIDFINVGYGDAVLVREKTADGKSFAMLIDCGDIRTGSDGAGSKRISAADFLEKEDVDRLDLLVITHLHLDHSGGLAKIIPRVRISELWCNYVPEPAFWGRQVNIPPGFSAGAKSLLESLNIYSLALKKLSDSGAKIRCVGQDQPSFSFGGKLFAHVFAEEALPQQREIWGRALEGRVTCEELDSLNEWINDTSLRMRLNYAGRHVELPGDFTAARWERGKVQKCAIVKLPHHGHPDSLTERLAAMLNADYTVVSVSNDRTDNCPSAKIAALSRAYSPRLLFTDAVTLPGVSPSFHESIRFRIFEDGIVEQEIRL